ncbi:MAG: electron transfer flavoprotein subunit beta/FixA family protein [Gammaproteobacteria bacterium]|nr:MAG: electron transfer flavoprotein subunit beta/FixA family protein [Gammaproteobacteria bacterium]
MKILVAVKRVVDYHVRVLPKADGSDVDIEHLKMSMNPFDEIAVEEALRLKEKGVAEEVIVVSIGPAACQETIRTALAMGADRGIQVEVGQAVEPLDAARLLQAVAQRTGPGIILLGKQAIDDDANQTGQMLAALLGWPQGTFACAVEVTGETVRVVREIDGGTQTVELRLPAVITTDLRLNEPRYAKLPEIMKAKRKPLEVLDPATLGVEPRPRLEQLRVSEPPARKPGVVVEDVTELVDRLRNEARVI